jgi:iron(III) transport system ATP-binding protein
MSDSCHVNLKNVACGYAEQIVLHDLSFSVARGEVACLLGPSGCGKTTALRAIAGFEPIRSGEIWLQNQLLSTTDISVPPEQRKLGMVFQDFALFPHLTVADNVAFGLRALSRKQRKQRVSEYLERVRLRGFEKRYPHELSGGQQQRVALARALAPMPELILLDEPFSSLDVSLREQLALEVRDILREADATAILVTHDQFEAFAMADHIGVLNNGELQQWASAFDLYHRPRNRFVAEFIGQGVFLPGERVAGNAVRTALGTLHSHQVPDASIGEKVTVLLRPDDLLPDPEADLKAKVIRRAFRGAETLYTLELENGQTVLSVFPSHHDHVPGEVVGLKVEADHVVVL